MSCRICHDRLMRGSVLTQRQWHIALEAPAKKLEVGARLEN